MGGSPARHNPGTKTGRGLARFLASSGVARLVTSLGQGWPRLEVPTPRSSRDRVKEGRSETAVSEWFQEAGVRASFNLGRMTTKGRSVKTLCGAAVGRAGPRLRPRPAAPPLAPPSSTPHPAGFPCRSCREEGAGVSAHAR